MAAAIDDHGRLLDAIERGDPHSAEQLNRKRIEAIRADVERSLSFY
jgi:DNA-binding GntR family transcriptional regulator